MAAEREANVMSEAVSGLFGLVRGELAALRGELVVVREEVARQKERNRVLENEVSELRRALGVVGERSVATAAVVEERGRVSAATTGELINLKSELIGVKGELAAVKRELNEHKVRTGESDMGAELAKERRREVQELNWPRAMEDLAACRKWVNVEMKISHSEGHTKTAWERIKAASRGTDLSLANLNGVSDAMLAHVSTMTHLKCIILKSSAGFCAEGIKHLYRLAGLEKIDLEGTVISDNALEGIGSLTNLKNLYLHKTKVTDTGLQHLTALSSLEALCLSECKGVTNAGMVHVGRLTRLERLAVDNTSVTDDGLKQLISLAKLTTLWPPKGSPILDDGVRRRIGR